jgi:hypothetical protein
MTGEELYADRAVGHSKGSLKRTRNLFTTESNQMARQGPDGLE